MDSLERRSTSSRRPVDARPQGGHDEADDERQAKPKPKPGSGGDAQPQRPRHDLEAHRRRPGLLAVELDRQRLGRLDLDARAAQERRLRVRQVRAAVGLRQRQQQVALRQVADQEDVEAAVVGLGLGQIFIPPPR